MPLRANSRYEIWKGTTNAGGLTFTWEAITEDSAEDNIRPFVPKTHGRSESLLWLKGSYTTYQNYNTRVVSKLEDKLTSYQQWESQNSIAGGPYDDDGDGKDNVLEYYRSVTGTSQMSPLLSAMGADSIQFSLAPSSTDLGVKLLASADLVNWDTIASSFYGSAFSLIDSSYALDGTSGQVVVSPPGSPVKQFYRLAVTVE